MGDLEQGDQDEEWTTREGQTVGDSPVSSHTVGAPKAGSEQKMKKQAAFLCRPAVTVIC